MILCKSADDSFKLVNLLRHKINSQGHYKAQGEWLQNGKFNIAGEQMTPSTKHKTIASVEIANSPKGGTKYAWGVRQSHSLPQAPAMQVQPYRDIYTFNDTSLQSTDTSKTYQPNYADDQPCRRLSVTEHFSPVSNSKNVSDAVVAKSRTNSETVLTDNNHVSSHDTSSMKTRTAEPLYDIPRVQGRPAGRYSQISKYGDGYLIDEQVVVMRAKRDVDRRKSIGELKSGCNKTHVWHVGAL